MWFTEPTSAFSGTVEINNITLDGAAEAPVAINQINSKSSHLKISSSSLSYTGSELDANIKVFDLTGTEILSAGKSLEFGNHLNSGLYYYSLSSKGSLIEQGKFSVLN